LRPVYSMSSENANSKAVVLAASAAASGGQVKLGTAQTLACGAIAGVASRTFTAPLDVTKILFQVQTHSIDANSAGKGYTSFFGALKQIFHEEGVKGLWKGNVVACLRLGPYSAVKYYTFETTKEYFKDANGKIPDINRAMCGALAGTLAVITTYPLDLVKTRLTVQKEGTNLVTGEVYKKTYNGTWDCLKKVVAQEGWTSLYKGLSPTIVGVIPFEAVQFTFYNWIKVWREGQKKASAEKSGKPHEAKLVTLDFLALGCVAGAVAQTAAYPFDLMRKRFMAQSKVAEGMLKTEYTGIWHCMTEIVKAEGLLGLYKGTTPNLLKVCPYAAIMWASYEQSRRLFEWVNVTGKNPFYKPESK